MGKASLTIAISGEYNGKAIEKAERSLQRMQTTAAAAMGGTAGQFVKTGAAAAEMGGKVYNAGSKIESIGKKATAGITVPITAAAVACGAAAVDIDDSLTSVRKTVDGTEDQYQSLKQAAVEFSKTNAVSASQILDIQALGAQLGFAIDELDQFSQVVSGLDIATDMDAETAATEMAQFANITKMAHGEVSNYGSTIVGLGNNMATTESKISSMAMRIAAAGTQVGMSQADILGLAAALSSMGIEAEAGGTAISTIMSQIDKDVATGSANLENWASTAKMSASDFAAAWKNDPVQALSAVLSGMEEATAEGGNMSLMLDELGISSLRQTDVMKRLAGNSELVADAVELANDEWEKNTALQAEVDNRNSSMSARFEILKNKVTAVAEEVGTPLVNALLDVVDAADPLIDGISGAAKAFADADPETQRFILGLVGLAAAAGPVLMVTGKVTKGIGSLITGFGRVSQWIGVTMSGVKNMGSTMQTVSAVTRTAGAEVQGFGMKASACGQNVAKTSAEVRTLNGGMQSAATGTTTMKNAMNALNGVCKATAIGLVIGLVADLAGQLMAYAEHEKLVEDATTSLTESLGAAETAYSSFTPSVEGATGAMQTAKVSTDEVLQSQRQLAETTQQTLSSLGTGAATVDYYAAEIRELGNKGNLTAAEQERLRLAVEGVNSATGSSIEVVNAQTGELNMAKDAVYQLIEAYKEEAKAQAYRELYAQTVKQMIQDQEALKQKTLELESASEGWGWWLGDFPVIADEASVKHHELEGEVSDLKAAYETTKSAADTYLEAIANSGQKFESFDAALEQSKVALSDFGNVGQESLNALRAGFDGSLQSIVATCAAKGIEIPQSLANAITANSGLPASAQRIMLDAMVLEMTGGDVTAAALALGHDIDAGLQAGIEGSAELPAAAIGMMSDQTIERAKEHWQSQSPSQVMVQLGNDIDAGLSQGIDGAADQPQASVDNLNTNLQTAIQNLPEFFRNIGDTSGNNLSTGLSGQEGSVKGSADRLNSTAQNSVSPMPGAFGDTGNRAGGNLAGGLGGQAGSVGGSASSLESSAERGISGTPGNFQSTGSDSANNFGNAIGSASAYGQGQSLANTANNGLGSVSAYSTGSNFASSFGNGMQGVSLWSIAWSVGRSALNGIKAALGIGSPSKEARKVAGFFGDGLVLGMDDIVPRVEKEADQISAAMMVTPPIADQKYGVKQASIDPASYTQSLTPHNPDTFRNPEATKVINVDFHVTVQMPAANTQNPREFGEAVSKTLYDEYQKQERALRNAISTY